MIKADDQLPEIKLFPVAGEQIVYRTGEAEKIIYPIAVKLEGDIRSVGSFLKVRRTNAKGVQTVDVKTAVVIISKSERSIQILLDPESVYGSSVKGVLKISPELDYFKINTSKVYKREDFRELIKFAKQYFTDKTAYAELLTSLGKLESTVNYSKNDSADDKGNKDVQFTRTVKSNIPDGFKIELPIYENFSEEIVNVDICIGVRDGDLHFWLESVMLDEMMDVKRDIILSEQLKEAEDLVTIYK